MYILKWNVVPSFMDNLAFETPIHANVYVNKNASYISYLKDDISGL